MNLSVRECREEKLNVNGIGIAIILQFLFERIWLKRLYHLIEMLIVVCDHVALLLLLLSVTVKACGGRIGPIFSCVVVSSAIEGWAVESVMSCCHRYAVDFVFSRYEGNGSSRNGVDSIFWQ